MTPKQSNKNQDRGGGLAPRTRLTIRPDRRAQAVLRAAERSKTNRTLSHGEGTLTTITNPGVGIKAEKLTTKYPQTSGTDSELSFKRYKPGSPDDVLYLDAYKSKRDLANGQRKPSTADSLHKDRLRSAAVKHAMGRQLTDIRPGSRANATTVRSEKGGNPRARAYEKYTNGAFNFDRGRRGSAETTKLSKTTWQPSNTSTPVRFNPNDLKNALKAMAMQRIVRATTRLIGGPWAQAAVNADDLTAAATGKRPSKVISSGHLQTQTRLANELLKRKQKQALWSGSGPF